MNRLYEFGAFRLNPSQRLLLREGRPVSVTPKAFELLVALVERSGKLVEKDELLGIVWPGVSVEEGNLAVMVSHLRKALRDDRGKREYIETVSKHGYRFIAPVTELGQTNSQEPLRLAAAAEVSTPAEIKMDRVPQGDIPSPADPPAQSEMAPLGTELSLAVAATRSQPQPREQPLAARFRRPPGRSLAVGLVLFAVAVAGLLAGRALMQRNQERSTAADAASIHSLVVLPFQMIGGSKSDEYLGLGTADALITKLGNIGRIIVRPTSAIENYKNTSLSPLAIGKEQGVDAVLDGIIQREGGRVRLTVQLIRVRDGAELWADTFDEKFTNIFELEDDVSDRVMGSLRLRLTDAAAKRITKRPTDNAMAYESYIKGRFFWNKRTGEGLKTGLQYFRDAINLDPGYAEAYEGVADSYASLGLYAKIPPDEAFPAARDAAQKALQMDDGLADARATLGMIHFYYDWDGAAAEKEFRRSIDANPNYAMAHSWRGETLAAMGRFPEAIEESKIALNDDPLSMIVNSNAGWTLFLAGQTDAAIETLKKAITMAPDFPRTYFRLAAIYQTIGSRDQAITEFQKAVQLSGGDPYDVASLANAYAGAGHAAEARQLLKTLTDRSAHEYIPAYAFAQIYAGLNEKDDAFAWLDKTPLDHSTSMVFAKVDPSLANLRSDPRFAAVIQHLNF